VVSKLGQYQNPTGPISKDEKKSVPGQEQQWWVTRSRRQDASNPPKTMHGTAAGEVKGTGRGGGGAIQYGKKMAKEPTHLFTYSFNKYEWITRSQPPPWEEKTV
jgi:hypothetical protein